MAADYTILSNIFTQVNNATAAYIGSTVGGVVAAITPVAKQCFTLYIFLWGIAMYRGAINEPIIDGASRLMRIGIILYFALTVGAYNTTIANNLVNLPDFLMGLVGTGNGAGAVSADWTTLDKVLSDMLNTGTTLWEAGSLSITDMNLGPIILALICWVTGLVVTGYAAFLIVLAKIALAVLVGIGPIFILCLMFEGTKKFFEAWLGQCINYALVAGLCMGVIKLLFGLFKNTAAAVLSAAEASGANFGFITISSLLGIAAISFLILMQVQSIASALGGGVAVSTLGAANWLSNATGLSALARQSRNTAGRALGQAGQKTATSAANAAKNSAKWAYRKVTGDSGKNSVGKAA